MRVLALGTFDLFHAGHVAFLARVRAIAGADGEVIVGLNTDRFAASYKRQPVVPYDGRRVVLEACRYVDRVVPNDQPGGSIAGIVDDLRVDAVAAPMDWFHRDWFGQVGVTILGFSERGVSVVWVQHEPGWSTTDLMGRM